MADGGAVGIFGLGISSLDPRSSTEVSVGLPGTPKHDPLPLLVVFCVRDNNTAPALVPPASV